MAAISAARTTTTECDYDTVEYQSDKITVKLKSVHWYSDMASTHGDRAKIQPSIDMECYMLHMKPIHECIPSLQGHATGS